MITQATGQIVQEAAEGLNATISVGTDDLECHVVGTSRIYDPEAVDIFGEGYFSLQIHVSQHLHVAANHFLWLDDVTSRVKPGFEIVTGGRTQFLNLLRQDALFRSVLSIELRGSLAPEDSPPPKPSGSPSFPPSQLYSSRIPTGFPTPNPSDFPSRSPTIIPTARPYEISSSAPTTKPSELPSASPSHIPSKIPSLSPSIVPSPVPTSSPSPGTSEQPTSTLISLTPTNGPQGFSSNGDGVGGSNHSSERPTSKPPLSSNNQNQDHVVIAAIAGGGATIMVSCLLTICFCWRRKKDEEENEKTKRKRFALTLRDGLSSQGTPNFFPGIVELDDDHQSLAETTLGEQTAGRQPHKKKHREPERRTKRPLEPKSRRVVGPIKPLDSFDESSLYTTPLSLQLDDGSAYFPSKSKGGSAYVSNRMMTPVDYEDNILFPMSDTNTDSSDGIYSSSPGSVARRPISVDEGPVDLDDELDDDDESSFMDHLRGVGPIDLDTQEPFADNESLVDLDDELDDGDENYFMDHLRGAGPIDLDTQEPFADTTVGDSLQTKSPAFKARQVSQAMEDGDLAFDPYEIDDWSVGFEDFDRGSDYYDDEAISKAPSYSSKSTAKINNIAPMLSAMQAPEEDHLSFSTNEEEKFEIGDERSVGGISHTHKASSSVHSFRTPPRKNLGESLDYMADTQSLEMSLSPSTLSSRKSIASKKSISSWSSRGSRNTSIASIGQPPRYPNSEHWFEKSHGDGDSTGVDRPDSTYHTPPAKKTTAPLTPSQHSHFSIPAVTPEVDEEESAMGESAALSETSQVGSGVIGMEPRDDNSANSGSTGMSANPWLFEMTEQTLGPRSVTADMDSLNGKSNLSNTSPSNRSKRSTPGSEVSFGSRVSYRSELAQSEVSLTPRTLEHDLRRLSLQLAVLDNDDVTTSSITASSVGASLTSVYSRHRTPKISRKKRIVLVVPPGKLGVILANRHDGKGTVVSEIRDHSALKGMLSPGDKLVAVDGEDVTGMVVSQITSLMASKAEQERRLTVVTSIAQQHLNFSGSKSDIGSR
jgi:hypothetical protein